MPAHMPASFTRHAFHKQKKEKEEHLNPHTITMELSLWANHPKAQLSLPSRGATNSLCNRTKLERHLAHFGAPLHNRHQMPSRRLFWAFLLSLRPDCLYPQARIIIPRGHPMSLSEAIAFNSHGVNLLAAFPAFTLLTHP